MNRAALILLFAVLIPASASGVEVKGQVIINTYHNIQNENFDYNLNILTNFLDSQSFGYKVSYSPISYPLLKNYDVFVLLLPTKEPLTTGEINAVLQFAQEGGGVLLIGESKDYVISTADNKTVTFDADYLNALSKKFGIAFNKDTLAEKKGDVSAHSIEILQFPAHALTSGVTSINLFLSATLNLSGNALKVVYGNENTYSEFYEVVSYPPVAAAARYGYGRVVALADTEGYLRLEDNKFLINTLNWLNIKAKIAEANAYLGNATQRLSFNDYKGAKEKFERALNIYTSLEINEKIAETKALIATCDKGIKANSLMDAAYSNYGNKKYAEAKAGFEEANKLYNELNYATKIAESQTMMDKTVQLVSGISQFNEATKYFDDGEYNKAREAFESAKKKFENSGDVEILKKCDEMILKSTRGIEALALLSLGEAQLKSRDFASARNSILQVKGIFTELGNAQKAQEVQALIEKADKYIAAYSKYNEAQAAFGREEYEQAMDAFSGAKALFGELGDQEMSSKSSEMLESSIEKIRERKTFRVAVVAGISVLVACGAIFVWWRGRQQKIGKAQPLKPTRKTAKIKELEEEIKKLELRYAQGGLSKKEYVYMRRGLEEKIEAEERKGKKLLFP